MSESQFAYSAVEPGKIAAQLSRMRSELKRSGKNFARAANGNMIVLSSDRSLNSCVDGLIECLAAVSPSRFFVIVPDPAAAALNIEISTFCVSVSGNENTCSEVIRIVAAPQMRSIVASIVRAQLLPAMPIGICVFDPKISAGDLERESLLADQLFFDSALFESRPDMLDRLAAVPGKSVDVQWLALARWRDSIRAVFDRLPARNALARLQKIEIESIGPDPDAPPMTALLLAGWICDRLKLKYGGRSGADRVLKTQDGRDVRIGFKRQGVSGDAALTSIKLSCGDSGDVTLATDTNSIITDVRIDPRYSVAYMYERDTRDALLHRYFLIGEATANYAAALRCGLALR